MSDLNPYELLKQFSHLLEVQDHFFASGLVGVFYLLYYQLGVAAHLQLISFHGVGEVKPIYDSLIFGLIIGGLEPKSEGVLYIDSVGRGQNQTCTTPLGVGGPIHGQLPDGEVGRQLGSFGRLRRGEFRDEIC